MEETAPGRGLRDHFAALPDPRIERRRCWTIEDRGVIAWLDPPGAWADLRTIAVVEGERQIGGERKAERRTYLSSLDGNAVRFLATVRSHWAIEHRRHWVLALALREDERRGGRATRRTTWRCCGTWRSPCCERRRPPRSGSRPSS